MKLGECICPLSWNVLLYTATFYMMVNRVKGGGRATSTLTSQGWFFHHDGMYARNRSLPLCVYSVGKPYTLPWIPPLVVWRHLWFSYSNRAKQVLEYHTVIRFVRVTRSAKFGTCTVVSVNGNLLKLKYTHSPLNLRIFLSSTSVPFTLTTVQVPNLVLV